MYLFCILSTHSLSRSLFPFHVHGHIVVCYLFLIYQSGGTRERAEALGFSTLSSLEGELTLYSDSSFFLLNCFSQKNQESKLSLVPTGPDPQELGFLPRSWGVLWVDRSRASRTSKKNLRAAFCPPTPGSYCLSSPANFILSFISQSGISKLAENANLSKWE